MTRLILKVMLFMMVVSLLFIATAAANSMVLMHYESGATRGEPSDAFFNFHHRTFFNFINYVIEQSQSHTHGYFDFSPGEGADSLGAQIISGNFPRLADGYNSDRLQDLINDFRTRV
jgi:hypothetical protein